MTTVEVTEVNNTVTTSEGASVNVTQQNVTVVAGAEAAIWGSITGTLSNQTDLQTALDAKQDALISGTNIKTINSTTILGSGNIAVATTAQGALADSALQSGDNISELTNDSGYITGVAWGGITGDISNQTDVTLQTVTDNGSVTTNNIDAAAFVTDGGTSSQFVKGDGSLDSTSYVSGAAGSDTEIQFNNSGAFGASSNFTYDGDFTMRDGLVKVSPTDSSSVDRITVPSTAVEQFITKSTSDSGTEVGLWTGLAVTGGTLSSTEQAYGLNGFCYPEGSSNLSAAQTGNNNANAYGGRYGVRIEDTSQVHTASGASAYNYHRGSGTVTNSWHFNSEGKNVLVDSGLTITNLMHYYADSINAVTGTVTNQYGLYIPNLSNATNNYGIFSENYLSLIGNSNDVALIGKNNRTLDYPAGSSVETGTSVIVVGHDNDAEDTSGGVADNVSVFGVNNDTKGSDVAAFGFNNTVGDATSDGGGVAFGGGNTVFGVGDTAIGFDNTSGSLVSSACIAVGKDCTASANSGTSVVVGNNSSATNVRAITVGDTCTNSGAASMVAGLDCTNTVGNSLVLGRNNSHSGTGSSSVIGQNNTSTMATFIAGDNCSSSASVLGLGSAVIGRSSSISGGIVSTSVAIGNQCILSGGGTFVDSAAIGNRVTVTATSAVAMGSQITNSTANSSEFGYSTGKISITTSALVPTVDIKLSSDSLKYFSGAGDDASVYYDGTNMIIDPDEVGSGRVLIGATGDDDMLLNDIEIDGDLNHDGTNVGFYGTAPATQPTALTTQLTDLSGDVTPATPDYALTATNNGWGCGSQDEFETMTSVILNLQARVQELEDKLQSVGLLA